MPGLGELIARYNAAKTPPTQRDYDGDGEPLDVDFWLRDRGMKVLSKDVKDGVTDGLSTVLELLSIPAKTHLQIV